MAEQTDWRNYINERREAYNARPAGLTLAARRVELLTLLRRLHIVGQKSLLSDVFASNEADAYSTPDGHTLRVLHEQERWDTVSSLCVEKDAQSVVIFLCRYSADGAKYEEVSAWDRIAAELSAALDELDGVRGSSDFELIADQLD